MVAASYTAAAAAVWSITLLTERAECNGERFSQSFLIKRKLKLELLSAQPYLMEISISGEVRCLRIRPSSASQM